MLSRFFAGCFGAAPIAIVGGTYVDFWNAAERGMASTGFAGAVFLGPVVGPIAGSYITHSSLGWRWTGWITMIVSGVLGLVAFFTVPETFAPVLMQRKAAKLRHQTKDWAIHSTIDETPIRPRDLVEKYFSKPFIMLFQEPIVSFRYPSGT
jgi:MFS family permease